jgi:hypothetical protein
MRDKSAATEANKIESTYAFRFLRKLSSWKNISLPLLCDALR